MSTYSLPQKSTQSYPVLARIHYEPFNGRFGLPNSVREALLAAGHGDTALVIDALMAVYYQEGKQFSVRQAKESLVAGGVYVPDGLLRRGLNPAVLKTGKRMTAGRPEITYFMPIVKNLAVFWAEGFLSKACDPLTVEDLQSLRLYRQALYREFIKRSPGAYSRQFLSQRLGVSKRTTFNYDRREGIYVQQRMSEAMFYTVGNWEDMFKALKPGKQWIRIRSGDSFVDKPLRLGIVYAWLGGHFGWGTRLFIVSQLSNKYSLREDWFIGDGHYRSPADVPAVDYTCGGLIAS